MLKVLQAFFIGQDACRNFKPGVLVRAIHVALRTKVRRGECAQLGINGPAFFHQTSALIATLNMRPVFRILPPQGLALLLAQAFDLFYAEVPVVQLTSFLLTIFSAMY